MELKPVKETEKVVSPEEYVKSQLKRGDKVESVMTLGNLINATVVDSNGQSTIRTFKRN